MGALVCAVLPAAAQGEVVLGRATPDPKLAVGTVKVRVLAGSLQAPVSGVEVQVAEAPGGTAASSGGRLSRTDPRGWASFPGLEPGVTAVAAVTGEGRETKSEPFIIPAAGGLRLVLSMAPWRDAQPAPAGADATDLPGRPPPQSMAGQPRPDSAMAIGSLSVRVLRGAWELPAGGETVHLVGYGGDGTVTKHTEVTDGAGRVTFADLSPRRAYYALAVLSRAAGPDRLASQVVMLPPQAGVRMVLSGARPEAGSGEQIDDLAARFHPQAGPPHGPAAGEVLVELLGDVAGVAEVELAEAGAPDVVARSPTAAPARAEIVGGQVLAPMRLGRHPVGTVAVHVVRSVDGSIAPIAGAEVLLRPANAAPGSRGAAVVLQSNTAGVAEFAGLQVGRDYQVVVTVRGVSLEPGSVRVPGDTGVVLPVVASWRSSDPLAAVFRSVPWGRGAVYVAQARKGGQIYRSNPFQLTASAGATVRLPIFPAARFGFDLIGFFNDTAMAFRGQFVIEHRSFAPLDPGPEGWLIPLPRGFLHASLEESAQALVAAVPEQGFVWRRVVPPFGAAFQGQFALPLEDGAFAFDWDLPAGAAASEIKLQYFDGMEVDVLGRARGAIEERSGHRFYVLANIDVDPRRRIVMQVRGLPRPPAWQRRARAAAGLIVLGILGWGAWGLAGRRTRCGSGASQSEAGRREHLLDALAELEGKKRAGAIADGRYRRLRKSLMKELETLEQRGWRSGESEPRSA